MKDILKKILEDCDHDIREWMNANSQEIDNLQSSNDGTSKTVIFYKNYQLLNDPVRTAIDWQMLRNHSRA